MSETKNIHLDMKQPSKSANDFDSTIVPLSQLVGSGLLETANSPFSFAVGMRPDLLPILANLERQGSWLIGGMAGSGKTIFIHSLIACMMYRSLPKDLKFAITAMKSNENEIYEKLPHLLQPIATTQTQTMDLINWAANEMMHRYVLFSKANVRNIKEYNSIQNKKDISVLPRIVIVIDELKQVMNVDSRKVEDVICRIGFMGKAAGIHLLLSTQYIEPCVITPKIKANIDHRIAFRCASEHESNIIIDSSGAEMLMNPGSLIYRSSNSGIVKLRGYYTSLSDLIGAISVVNRRYSPDLSCSTVSKKANRRELGRAFSEVHQILLHTSDSVKVLIPPQFMKFLRENMDHAWRGDLDFSKRLNDMDLRRDTRVLLSLVYRDFLCSPEERKKLIDADRKTAMAEGWEFTDQSLMDMLRSWGY